MGNTFWVKHSGGPAQSVDSDAYEAFVAAQADGRVIEANVNGVQVSGPKQIVSGLNR